jgi:hypothetical protein
MMMLMVVSSRPCRLSVVVPEEARLALSAIFLDPNRIVSMWSSHLSMRP